MQCSDFQVHLMQQEIEEEKVNNFKFNNRYLSVRVYRKIPRRIYPHAIFLVHGQRREDTDHLHQKDYRQEFFNNSIHLYFL